MGLLTFPERVSLPDCLGVNLQVSPHGKKKVLKESERWEVEEYLAEKAGRKRWYKDEPEGETAPKILCKSGFSIAWSIEIEVHHMGFTDANYCATDV